MIFREYKNSDYNDCLNILMEFYKTCLPDLKLLKKYESLKYLMSNYLDNDLIQSDIFYVCELDQKVVGYICSISDFSNNNNDSFEYKFKDTLYEINDFNNFKKNEQILWSKADKFINLDSKLKSSYIQSFYVLSKNQGFGIGKQLMDLVISELIKEDKDNLLVWTDLDCNFKFYEKYGFKLDSTFKDDNLSEKTLSNRDNGIRYYFNLKKC